MRIKIGKICQARELFNYGCFVGVEEDAANDVKVYPNPFSDRIVITGMNGEASVKLYSVLGEEIASATMDGKVDGCPQTICRLAYLLEIANGNGRPVIRLVKSEDH